MSKITMLSNDLFDDGSLECFNYWLATDEGCTQVDASFVLNTLGLRNLVETNRDKGYISSKQLNLSYGGLNVLEVQWG